MQISGELRRSGSVRPFGLRGSGTGSGHDMNVIFSKSSLRRADEEEQVLTWAALERLPTYDRVRRGLVHNDLGEQCEVDVTNLSFQDRQLLIERLFNMADDNAQQFLFKMREQIDKVGLGLPRIEVRYQQLSVDADVYVGSRAQPTIPNYILNMTEEETTVHSGRRQWYHQTRQIDPSAGTAWLWENNFTLNFSRRTRLGSAKIGEDIGHDLKEFVPQRTSAYVSQRDLHIAELTVRETLDFSGRCQGVGTRYDMLVELSRREKHAGIIPDEDIDIFMKAAALGDEKAYSIVTDYILKILGLDICSDTMVGDEMNRGISGGQMKRLTMGELLVGLARVLFMDDVSTGLDSSTTFQIIKYLRQSMHALDGTTVISLLEPAPETFELFDDIILLSEGQIVYQGPREYVLAFFESLGFRCLERKGEADFLQEKETILFCRHVEGEDFWCGRSGHVATSSKSSTWDWPSNPRPVQMLSLQLMQRLRF